MFSEGSLAYKVWCRRMGTESPKECHSMYTSSDEDLFEPMEDSTTNQGLFYPVMPSITTFAESQRISTFVPTPPQTPGSISRHGSANVGVDLSCVASTVFADVLNTPTVESGEQQGCSRLASSFDNTRPHIPPDMYNYYSPALNSSQNVESFKMTEEQVRVLNELEGIDHKFIVGKILSIIDSYFSEHQYECLVTQLLKTLSTSENASPYVHVQGEKNCVREVLLAYARTYGIRGLFCKWMEVDCTKDGCNHCNIITLVLTKLPFLCLKYVAH